METRSQFEFMAWVVNVCSKPHALMKGECGEMDENVVYYHDGVKAMRGELKGDVLPAASWHVTAKAPITCGAEAEVDECLLFTREH